MFPRAPHGNLSTKTALATMAKSLSELKRMQKTQLSRLTKEDLIESILSAPESNEGVLKTLMEKFQDVVEQVGELKQIITSPDSSINKRISDLQDQVNRQADIIARQQSYLEAVDRRERETNIIVTGVPNENEALEEATTDDNKLSVIWTKVEAVEEIKEHRRLETKVDNRRRPILITVSSKQARDKVQKVKQL